MQKRIKKSIMTVTIVSIVLLAAMLSFIFYWLLAEQVTFTLWDRAGILQQVLNESEDKTETLSVLNRQASKIRYTLIESDGAVLFDSHSSIEFLENHSQRVEFQEAIHTGRGESKRYSKTIGFESYYVAYKLDDGSVIRLSESSRSIFGVFRSIIPGTIFVVAIVLSIGRILSKHLTDKIIEPINNIDLMDENIVLYDELSIFLLTIDMYKKRVKEQIADIKNQSDLINTIINTIKEGIVLLDHQGVIITANKSAMGLFHVEDDVLGKNILEFTRNNDIFENTQKALGKESCDIMFSNNNRCYQIFFSPATEGGVIILFLDITAKINAEKMRREFTGNVTHELKTPLTSISGYAEMMSSGLAKPEDFVTFSKRINDETTRLMLLVDDILMLSQLDEGESQLEKQKTDLSIVAKQVMESLSEKAAKNNVSLMIDGDNVIANVNPSMIYELVFNLVDNGIKYNKVNGSVTVSLSSDDVSAMIVVKDTGIGITKDNQDRIFERFFRVDKSRSKKTGGTGLGLSIVKHIARIHNGTILLESEEDVGTTIMVTFTTST